MRSRRIRCRWRSGLRSRTIIHRKNAYRRQAIRTREEENSPSAASQDLGDWPGSGEPGTNLCAESDVTFLPLDRRKETMGNRPAGYWILVLIAIAAAVAAFMMRSSPDPHTRAMAQYLGWGAIA